MDHLQDITRRLERIEEKLDTYTERTAIIETKLTSIGKGIWLLALSLISMVGYLAKDFLTNMRP